VNEVDPVIRYAIGQSDTVTQVRSPWTLLYIGVNTSYRN